MSEWKEYKLGDICDLIAGFAFKSKDFGNYNHKVVKIKDIKPPFISLDSISYVDISKYDEKKLAKYIVKKGDFLLAMTGATIGKLGKYIYSEPSYLNQRVLNIIPHYDVDKDFIYFSISSDYFQSYVINHVDSESAQPNISANTIGKYPIFLPDLDEQRKISSIFRNIENKIICNRKINENLEQQAQALFKSWFVDFEPFKDGEFEESELGRIPKGWKVMSLTDIADYLNGLAMQKFRPSEGEKDLPVLKIKELGNGSCDSSSDRCSANISPEYIIENGDIIFSWSGTLLVDIWCGGRCGLNQHLFKVTSNNYPKWFYWLWTAKHLENFKFIARDKAVTMGHIKRSHLQEALVVVPNEETFKKADSIFAPIIDHIIESRIESRTLSQLRDTLLPKLMSGELKVNEI